MFAFCDHLLQIKYTNEWKVIFYGLNSGQFCQLLSLFYNNIIHKSNKNSCARAEGLLCYKYIIQSNKWVNNFHQISKAIKMWKIL